MSYQPRDQPDQHPPHSPPPRVRLTSIWELDATIISYISPKTVANLTSIDAPIPGARSIGYHYSSGNLITGIFYLADLLGAGYNPIHNGRIFHMIHDLVAHQLGIGFQPWRRSERVDTLWNPFPSPTDEYERLVDDLVPYTALASMGEAEASTLCRMIALLKDPSSTNVKGHHIQEMCCLLGMDIPAPVYDIVIDAIVMFGQRLLGEPDAFGREHDGVPYPWVRTTGSVERPYLATLDWIFYEVVSHRRNLDSDEQVCGDRGYYHALEALARNKKLMSHIWYSFLEEVITLHEDAPHPLSDEARASLLARLWEAWPEIEAVAESGEGTDFNVVVMDQDYLFDELIDAGYYRTLDWALTMALAPLRRIRDWTIRPSMVENLENTYVEGGMRTEMVKDASPETYQVLVKHGLTLRQ